MTIEKGGDLNQLSAFSDLDEKSKQTYMKTEEFKSLDLLRKELTVKAKV